MDKDESKSGVAGKSLGTSIIDSALDPHVLNKLGDVADVLLTWKYARTILGNIPVLDKACKVYGLHTSIHNDLFLKKITGFLSGCKKMTGGEKTEFGQRLENDANYRRKVGESLLLILDRLDDFDKTEILGKVFTARYKSEIDEATFLRLATAICNASIVDLKMLSSSYDKIATYDMKAGKPFSDSLDDATAQALFSVGLVRADGYMEMTYHSNELGSSLMQLMKQ